MSQPDKLIIKNSVTFDDNEIDLLFAYLESVRYKELRSVLMQDIFVVNSKSLKEPLESISIDIVFDHLKSDYYYFKALLMPVFYKNEGYADFKLDFNCFEDHMYRDTSKLIIDKNRAIELNNGVLKLTYSLFSGTDHIMLKLEDQKEFKVSLLKFIKFVYTVTSNIVPECNFAVILNISKIAGVKEQYFENDPSLKSVRIPDALQKVIERNENTIYHPDNSGCIVEETCCKTEVKKAIEYSVDKKEEIPQALKRVLANAK